MARAKAGFGHIVAGNEIAARIILADPVKYAGLMVMWAQLWMRRHKETL
jgi:hypothetical protein